MKPTPSIAIFDLDGTLTKRDTFLPFLLTIIKIRPSRLPYIPILPFFVLFYYLKIIDNHKLKQAFLFAFLAGVEVDHVLSVASTFAGQLFKSGMNPAGMKMLRYHIDRGDHVIIATASFCFYVKTLADCLGVDDIICTEAEIVAGRLTGRIKGLNCHGKEKLRRIKLCLGNTPDKNIIAYSDHSSDFPMLEWAGKGYLVTPTRKCLRNPISKKFQIIK